MPGWGEILSGGEVTNCGDDIIQGGGVVIKCDRDWIQCGG